MEHESNRDDGETIGGVRPTEVRSVAFWKGATRFQIIYSMTGLILGVAIIFSGIVLLIRGISGASSWAADVLGLSSAMSDAPPGLILTVVGLLIVYITRYDVSGSNK